MRRVLAALLFVAMRLAAQSPPARPRLIGVFSAGSGAPIFGVEVRDVFSGDHTVTDSTGTARLDFVTFRGEAGIVELRKIGYEPKQILMAKGDTASVTEVLQPMPTLAPVVTTEKYRVDRDEGHWDTFEQRCQTRSPTCYRQEDMDEKVNANLADLIVHAAGVTISSCGGGRKAPGVPCGAFAMKPTVSPPAFCLPTFFVDGFEWDVRSGAPADLVPGSPAVAPFSPANVKAMEVYPPGKSRPGRFMGDPRCGAVVIWTK